MAKWHLRSLWSRPPTLSIPLRRAGAGSPELGTDHQKGRRSQLWHRNWGPWWSTLPFEVVGRFGGSRGGAG